MDLLFQNNTIQLNGHFTVDYIIQKINDLLEDRYYFSHLISDGTEIYEEPEQYLSDHLTEINQLEVVAKTVQEFVNDLLITAGDYIQRAKPEITSLSDEFYQNPITNSWSNFAQLLEGIQWLNQMITSIDQAKEQPSNWLEYIKHTANLQIELKNLEEAVENNDSVLIADIIQYEILPIFEALEIEIQTTIDTEGYRHDLN